MAPLQSLLRVRYWIALPLALIGLAIGAIVGYRITEPVYKSSGAIRVKPVLPRILYALDQNTPMPMFESFMESQVSLVRSPRVSDLAMRDPKWQGLGRGLTPEAIAHYRSRLDVSHPRDSEIIRVDFSDPDPQA